MKALNVLSVFDGISCGHIAFDRAGIKVDKYIASEIKQCAIKVTMNNYPDTLQIGDVTKVHYEDGVLYKECERKSIENEDGSETIEWTLGTPVHEGSIDILIGGSPCQDFSSASLLTPYKDHKKYGLKGLKSRLFYEYLRLKKEINPTWFLLENVKMKAASEKELNDYMGVKGIHINSNLVSFQNRHRIYWTNIPDVKVPEDKHINFQDFKDIDPDYCKQFKVKKTPSRLRMWNNGVQDGIGTCPNITDKKKINCLTRKQDRCPNSGLVAFEDFCRYLTRREIELAQTLPVGYTDSISYGQMQDVCGDGWTVDVIAHIFTYIKKAKENNDMELKINDYQLPEKISFNYEEIKNEVAEKVKHYANLVYTEDQIKDAKSDRATLNKFVKALEDKRKEIKKQCLEPYEQFEAQMKEIIAIVNEPIAMIDSQVKGYEEQKKAEKLEKIKEYFNEKNTHNFLDLELIMDSKWLNASASIKSIQDAIDERLLQVGKDIATLSTLPEFGFEATALYKTTLDVNKAINEAKRMSEIAKAKAEAKKQEEVAPKTPIGQAIESIERQAFEQVEKQWVSFSALLSTQDALALKDFFNSRNIEFKPL